MTLRHAILAALTDGESSGYDLAKRFDVAVANFWSATPQQLYRELDSMDADGLVQARVVRQERRPNKRVFSLAEAGRTALREFSERSPKPVVIRDELLVQLQAAELGDLASIRAHLGRKREAAQRKLEDYLALRERMLDGASEQDYLASSPRLGPFLTLARGIAFEQENVRWSEFALAALDREV